MNLEWNYFYSSLSQSAAAIVGIFGAFIVSRILSNQTSYAQKLASCRESLRYSSKLLGRANDLDIQRFVGKRVSAGLNKIRGLRGADIDHPASYYYSELDFPVFADKAEVLEKIEKVLESRRTAYAEENSKIALSDLVNPVNRRVIDRLTGRPSGKDDEWEEIYSLAQECKRQAELIAEHYDSIKGNPESSTQITYTLVLMAVLFFSGVIYPLSFMPVPPGGVVLSLSAFWPNFYSLKGVLLLVMGGIFSSVLLIFLRLNWSLKYPRYEVKQLERFSEIGTYSKYFESMEKNTIAGLIKKQNKKFTDT
ncbi:MAG: hypothetical protein VR73_14845 [Gammaproteobacteria bacterium BRH_c0]|nr:MAG: hypothetical protein VR73_14845 [Gammaproteobacteria bacterium BRH_c0]